MDGEPRRVSSDHHSRRPNGSISTIATARSADDREATELDPVHTVDAASSGNNSNAHSSRRILDSDLAPASCPQPAPQHWYHAIFRFWHHYIHLAVPHADCRDHLANERTFLAYQRTSIALSMIGIVTTQLFNLEQEQDTRISFGYYALSKPLGALFQIAAILVITIGTHRWWRQQMSMARGKVWAGGWEVYTIMGTVFALMALVFCLLIAIGIQENKAAI